MILFDLMGFHEFVGGLDVNFFVDIICAKSGLGCFTEPVMYVLDALYVFEEGTQRGRQGKHFLQMSPIKGET